jgi:ATP-dependent DNA helicase RecQ
VVCAGKIMNQAWRWTTDNERKAKRRLGVNVYRPGQRELIQAVMDGRNALGILPTGGGKSLCYQLPALFLPNAILVISPLISLMQDQHDKLTERNITAANLNSTLSACEERDLVQEIWDGEPELIYITPERLENHDYLELLNKTGVSLIVVDEAHLMTCSRFRYESKGLRVALPCRYPVLYPVDSPNQARRSRVRPGSRVMCRAGRRLVCSRPE